MGGGGEVRRREGRSRRGWEGWEGGEERRMGREMGRMGRDGDERKRIIRLHEHYKHGEGMSTKENFLITLYFTVIGLFPF